MFLRRQLSLFWEFLSYNLSFMSPYGRKIDFQSLDLRKIVLMVVFLLLVFLFCFVFLKLFQNQLQGERSTKPFIWWK